MSTTDEPSPPVLILAPVGRDAAATAELLSRAGIDTERVADLDALLRLIVDAAVVLVAEEALFGKDYTELAKVIEAQPAWSDLPFVVLTSRHELPSIGQWRRRLIEALRNVSLLERPVQTITLVTTVQAALRARRRQHEVRELVEAQESAALQLEALVEDRTRELASTNAELRKQIEERARAEDTLRQAQKIEAIGQLTGGIAHDFNNLLMVISGGLEMLERTSDVARRHRLLDGMRQAAQRGAGLTRQLLAFSRRTKLNPEAVDLGRQINGMRELLDRSLREDVEVRYELEPGLWPVEVDPGELELVILNLAVNSRDAMPRGGTIVIRAGNLPANADGHATDCVCLSVEDNGSGMTREVQEHVFEPFFTTKEVGKGSGLGLAQVYGFAKQSGGSVDIDSEIGRGTRVTLTLPRSHRIPAAQPHHIAAHTQQRPSPSAGSVLLVEDDNQVAALVSQMLDELGYEVTRAATAAAALGALADDRKVDVVFSDIMMPGGMNGVELARQIRARRPGLPVVLTSGYAEAVESADRDADVRVLPKPYHLNDLAVALREARARRH